MSNNYSQGHYTVLNPEKYVGKGTPKYRSGWELTFMRFCDNHPSVVSWASECVRIPYKNPFTGRDTFYVPDFLVTYQTASGNRAELVEIKPKAQVVMELARSQQEKMAVALNMCKWQAAKIWCKRMGCSFRILTEEDIFNNANPTRKRRK
jgi:hypothetical protein